jgi:alkanesulfonate monooxygenase SsuD/methylene tetrahydromethanopterin reductase-like flavin-dependent oxidoreductase (luciferase family)
MQLDLFCSLAQSPRAGALPSHAQLLREFLDQAVLADELGFGCLWVAESHFSSELQKRHAQPVIPHWQGEIGVNTDICQLAGQVFRRTRRIEVGSAIMNIVANGGPLPAAERVAAALAWHGLDATESRRLNIGFAGGRFDYIGRATGIRPRTPKEERAWPRVKTAILAEAAEIFVRLLGGESIAAEDIPERVVDGELLPRRWEFELTRIVPDFRRELLRLYLGSHDPALQIELNRHAPVRVFNLSITPPDIIEATHARMATAFHPDGGAWGRADMPRTVMVFVDAQRDVATRRAEAALAAYWRGLDGTIDAAKIAGSVDNALVGTPEDVAAAIARCFQPDERLMLWFDFFAESGAQVLSDLRTFHDHVIPRLAEHGIAVKRT